MASFAAQAIPQLLSRISIYRLEECKAATSVDDTLAKVHKSPVPHAEFVGRFARR